MSNTYFETEAKIDSLIIQYGQVAVNMAISYLIRIGANTLTEEYVEKEKIKIQKQNEKMKGNPIITAEFECIIVDVAFELSKLDEINILAYVQEHSLYNSISNSISKERMSVLLHNVLSALNDKFDNDIGFIETLIDECDFVDDEIEKLGFSEQFIAYENDVD